MTLDEVFAALAREALGQAPSDEGALALMILLHTHQVRFGQPVFDDRPGVTEVAALTHRGCAEMVAAAWPDRAAPRRTRKDYTFWYHEYVCRTPFEVIEDVPSPWRARVEAIKGRVLANRQVAAIDPEED